MTNTNHTGLNYDFLKWMYGKHLGSNTEKYVLRSNSRTMPKMLITKQTAFVFLFRKYNRHAKNGIFAGVCAVGAADV